MMKTLSPSRRQLLRQAGCGVGLLGLAGILHDEGLLLSGSSHRGEPDGSARNRIFPQRQNESFGSSSTADRARSTRGTTSPQLAKWDGKSMRQFDRSSRTRRAFSRTRSAIIMKSPFTFTPRGECGKMVSSIFPHLGQHVDKMAFIHSAYSESNNHSTALFKMNCGLPRMGFPCVGSWVTYGLGSPSQDLPGFVVMSDPQGRGLPKAHAANWTAGFLPGVYQGTHLKPQGQPIDNLILPANLTDEASEISWHSCVRPTRYIESKWQRKRSWMRASRASNSLIACNRLRRKHSMSIPNRNTSSNCTASMTNAANRLPDSV